MLKDDVLEFGSTVGDGATLSLNGAVDDTRQRFRDRYATSSVVFYCDRTTESSPNGDKREYGWGVLTWGTTDTIARNVLLSTNSNNKVDWLADDEHIVYQAPLLDVLGPLLIGHLGTLPDWAQAGFARWDVSAGLATRWIRKLFNGTSEIEVGRYHADNGVYTPSMSMDVVDIGAAGTNVDSTHKDKFLRFDVTAANRACTFPAGASLGKGFAVGVYGYGSTGNDVVLTPNGSEKFNEESGGATLAVAGGSPKLVRWDHVGGQWLVHG